MFKYIAHGHLAKGDYTFLSNGDLDSNAVNYLKVREGELPFKQRFDIGLSLADQNAKLEGYVNKNINSFQQYINLSVKEVYIRERSNLLHCIDPIFTPNSKDVVIIRTHYVIDGSHSLTYKSICKYMDSVKNLPMTVDKEIREVYSEFLKSKQPPNLRKSPVYIISYDVEVPISVLDIGPTYITNKDVVLTTHYELPDHPFTINGGYDSVISKIENELNINTSPPLFIAEIIDNSDNVSARYTYCLNQIVEVPVVKNANKSDGIYLNIRQNGTYIQVVETLDKLNSFGLYKTKEEAYSGGDISNKLNHELILAKTELEQLKLKNLTAKEELDKRSRELDFEYKEKIMAIELENKKTIDFLKIELLNKENDNQNLKVVIEKQKLEFDLERSRLEQEKIKLKDQFDSLEKYRTNHYDSMKRVREDTYDSRKHERSDSSDSVKFAITVAAGLVSVFMLFSKL